MRLATLNVWDLPWPISRERSARMDAIGERLPSLALDAMLFQEVWTGSSRERLIEAGARAGLVHFWHHGVAIGGSGLLMLSRARFEKAHFEAFLVRGFPHRIWQGDYHGGKGFCALRFEVGGRPLTLIDTHLHARYKHAGIDDELPHRIAQNVQLAAFIAATPEPVIAAGDFNMEDDHPEYAVFTGLSGMRDAAVETDRRQPTTLGANLYRNESPPHDDERIDYIFARDGDGGRLRVRSIERIFDEPPARGPAEYSDHAGLIAEIDLEPDDSSRAPALEAAAADLAARALASGRAAAEARRGERRGAALSALAGAALAGAAARQPRLSRRRVLRAGLGAGALLAFPFGLSNAALAEISIPDEVGAFDAVVERLAALESRATPRHR